MSFQSRKISSRGALEFTAPRYRSPSSCSSAVASLPGSGASSGFWIVAAFSELLADATAPCASGGIVGSDRRQNEDSSSPYLCLGHSSKLNYWPSERCPGKPGHLVGEDLAGDHTLAL
jgi:hypothetical protein